MGFTDAVKTCFSKYVTFSGRASRSEYWWFSLFISLGSIVAAIVDMLLFGYDPVAPGSVGWISGLFTLAIFLPSLSVMVRRLHDKDRSGWWYFIVLIPLIGLFILLYWFVTRGTVGPNRFGPDPLGETNVEGVF